ncbi:hypothetical protein OAN307_c11480 [Octadecabacter antarcticus 307]|uniref:Uncharacterized protein n=2 Tax=Octadecabacter TaxID=53945 RepID=M9RAQ6_9RHOB|nr:hypothetical protein OAN307_c11480 [Octadecabacter antarcticus 307]
MVAQSLAATIAAHPDCGVALWGPRRLRDIPGFQVATQRLDEDIDPIDKTAAIGLDQVASLIARDVALERERGIHTLILSEENFIGGMRNNFQTCEFYPDVAHRLASFDSLLPMSPMRVVLGVREYGAVWTSAYHYQPQSGRDFPDLERARTTLLDNKRGWPEVANAVREVWPDAGLIMWQQEHLVMSGAQICAQIMGLSADQIVISTGKVNALKSTSARPEVFSAQEQKHLSHRYNRHLRRLRSSADCLWIGGDPE